MAKKQTETVSLIETFTDFKKNKHIDITTMIGVLEESFHSVIAKIFGSDENFDVIVNPKRGTAKSIATVSLWKMTTWRTLTSKSL